jgi:hypothetical protein
MRIRIRLSLFYVDQDLVKVLLFIFNKPIQCHKKGKFKNNKKSSLGFDSFLGIGTPFVDPECIIPDPDPTFNVIPNPDPILKSGASRIPIY